MASADAPLTKSATSLLSCYLQLVPQAQSCTDTDLLLLHTVLTVFMRMNAPAQTTRHRTPKNARGDLCCTALPCNVVRLASIAAAAVDRESRAQFTRLIYCFLLSIICSLGRLLCTDPRLDVLFEAEG
jgi:hypothetical protein